MSKCGKILKSATFALIEVSSEKQLYDTLGYLEDLTGAEHRVVTMDLRPECKFNVLVSASVPGVEPLKVRHILYSIGNATEWDKDA
ncbi:MAG: hypothetical protein IKV68_06260 [Oscillospiraceae bacterium]|nr:hypothetical protein [Oscillospiraceae bacterium]